MSDFLSLDEPDSLIEDAKIVLSYVRLEEGESIPKRSLKYVGCGTLNDFGYKVWSYVDPMGRAMIAILEHRVGDKYPMVLSRSAEGLSPADALVKYHSAKGRG
jgi:hypothetical protein